ncbi:MAG: hypothetical protein IM574_01550 [Cytophagales bacterium]|jgi:hypothetical protein|nr:hypothetical protein [Cytophagales bacterium]MCA6387569.1 hypothetical protein [Cytophagales bacterium]MCA6390312.1 hypothetical protein [Cytophagales bacterium]MCA6399354.1 hypothetical protein [Cytophagales bacterium]MCA6400632.1 hypothetical protein [Cytophagales bacterium]
MLQQTKSFSLEVNLPCCVVPVELFNHFEGVVKKSLERKFTIPNYAINLREHYSLGIDYPAHQIKQLIGADKNWKINFQTTLELKISKQTLLDQYCESRIKSFLHSKQKVFIDAYNYISVYYAIEKILIELGTAHLIRSIDMLRLSPLKAANSQDDDPN